MATLLEKWEFLHSDSTLPKRVESAILKASYDVINEGSGTANHAARLAWANSVRLSPAELAASMTQGVMACLDNPTIQQDPLNATDNDIQFVINSIVDRLSGVGA